MTTLFISHSSKDKTSAEEIRDALVGKGYESLFLDSHPEDGIPVGAKWERTLWQSLRQSRGVVVLCTSNWLGSPWCVAEVIIARDLGKPVFILTTAKVPDFLNDTQFGLATHSLLEADAFGKLLHGLEKAGLKDDFPLPESPTLGWRPSRSGMPLSSSVERTREKK